MASRWRVMGEKNNSNNSCRVVANVDSRHHHQHDLNKVPPKSSPISYFLNISITTNKSRVPNESNPKFRIKIPKLLAKTVKKKELQHQNHGTTASKPGEGNNEVKMKKWDKQKLLLHVNKVTSLFSSLKKPESTSDSGRRETESPRNSSNVGRNVDEEQYQNPLRDEEDEEENRNSIGSLADSASSSSFKSMTSSLFSLNISGDYPASNSPSFDDFIDQPKENMKTKEKQEEDDDDVDSAGLNGTCGSTFRLPFKATSSFKNFMNKKTTCLSFINKGNSNNSSTSSNSIYSDGGNEEVEQVVEEEVDRKSCGYDQKRTWMNGMSGMKLVNRKKKPSHDDKELWKKRILLGEKCKPLNLSEVVQPPPRAP